MSVKLVDNTQKVKLALREQIAGGINNALAMGVDEARDLVPVDTGFTRDHIGITKLATADDLSGEARSLSWYSGLINYGTSRMAAQPFWTVSWLLVRQSLPYLFKSGFIQIRRGASAGPGITRAAAMDYFGPLGRKGGGI